MDLVKQLTIEVQNLADTNKALSMAKYMRNQFPFAGISSPQLKAMIKPLFKQYATTDNQEIQATAYQLWEKPEREYQYIAIEYLKANQAHTHLSCIETVERLILSKSWWDTIDHLAPHIAGSYFLHYPDSLPFYVNRWLTHDSLWLRRSAIIFQLRYKQKTQIPILEKVILSCKDEKEFFIRKAIGWVLRQYSYINPEYVKHFTNTHVLSPLSKREALKAIKRKVEIRKNV